MEKVIKRRTKNIKGIGDPTTVTIPRTYIDYVTKEEREVTEDLLALVNDALKKREFVHLVMSGISYVNAQKDITDLLQDFHKSFSKLVH